MKNRKGFGCRSGWLVVAAGLMLTGCATIPEAEPSHDEPLSVEAIEGSDGLSRLTITQQASDRLDIATSEVSVENVSHGDQQSQRRKVVPYSAVMYDPEGGTWVYISQEPLVFERSAITVDFIDGETAALLKGPAKGTTVVTVGSAELYGAEFGVDK